MDYLKKILRQWQAYFSVLANSMQRIRIGNSLALDYKTPPITGFFLLLMKERETFAIRNGLNQPFLSFMESEAWDLLFKKCQEEFSETNKLAPSLLTGIMKSLWFTIELATS